MEPGSGTAFLLALYAALAKNRSPRQLCLACCSAVCSCSQRFCDAAADLDSGPDADLSMMVLFVVATADRYWQERKARQATVDLFGRFLDPVVVAELAEQGCDQNTRRQTV